MEALRPGSRPAPTAPAEPGIVQSNMARWREEVGPGGALAKRVDDLPRADADLTLAFDEARKAVFGDDPFVAEKAVAELKKQLQAAEKLHAEIQRLREQLRPELSDRARLDPQQKRDATSADLEESLGLLPQARDSLVRLRESLQPDGVCRELEAELRGSLSESVAHVPKDGGRDRALQSLNDGLAAAKRNDLAATKAQVAQLKQLLLLQRPANRIRQEANVDERIRLAEEYLAKNTANTKDTVEVEDVLAQALKQQGVEKAMATFLAQLSDWHDEQDNPKGKFTVSSDVSLGRDKLDALSRQTGLSPVEVQAIHVYTGGGYMTINPAIANQKDHKAKRRGGASGKDWMDQNPASNESMADDYYAEFPDFKDPRYRKGKQDPQYLRDVEAYEARTRTRNKLYDQGAVVGAFVLSAMKKLPPKRGTTYRGMRMSPGAFNDTYQKGKVITDDAFTSQSTNVDLAEAYAQGDGNVKIQPDQTVHVLIETYVYSGRDVKAMSKYPKEDELTLLPGTSYRVQDIVEQPNGPAGLPHVPPATAWRRVQMIQVNQV